VLKILKSRTITLSAFSKKIEKKMALFFNFCGNVPIEFAQESIVHPSLSQFKQSN
jgi:hypothetical protein